MPYDDGMKLPHASWFAGLGLAVCSYGLDLSAGSQPGRLGWGAAAAAKGDAAGAASKKGGAWVDYEAPDGLYKAKFPEPPQAQTQKGVPTFVIARYQTVGGLNNGPLYYVSAMVGKSQNTPPTDLLPGLLTTAEQQGFQSLGVQVSDSKPIKDSQGNPGRRMKLTDPKSHRVGLGKVLVNRLTGAFLIVAAFGPDAEAFLKSAQFA